MQEDITKRLLSHKKPFLTPISHEGVIPCALSCFKNNTKFENHCWMFNFDGLQETIRASHVGLVCEVIIVTMKDVSSSNFVIVKFVRFLNNVEMACIVAKSSQTLGINSCPLPPSIWIEEVLKIVGTIPTPKEHCSLLIHVIRDLLLTWRRIHFSKRKSKKQKKKQEKTKKNLRKWKILMRRVKEKQMKKRKPWENENPKKKSKKEKKIRKRRTWEKTNPK